MKPLTLFAVASFACALGCGAVANDDGSVGATAQEIRGNPSQLLTQIDRSGVPYELYVTTCNPMPNVKDYVQMQACENNGTDIRQVSVQILDASGALVARLDQSDIVSDRPGGGCIHFQLPAAPVGGSLAIHANVKGLAGAGSATTVFDITTNL
jgi:hypothetical protein